MKMSHIFEFHKKGTFTSQNLHVPMHGVTLFKQYKAIQNNMN